MLCKIHWKLTPPPLPMEAKRNILIWCDFLKCEKINKKNGIHNLADLIDSNINKKNSNFFWGGGNSTCNSVIKAVMLLNDNRCELNKQPETWVFLYLTWHFISFRYFVSFTWPVSGAALWVPLANMWTLHSHPVMYEWLPNSFLE